MKIRSAVRIYFVVYGGLIILSVYLIGHNYYKQLQQAEESTLSKLYGITSTLAQQVDRDAIQAVFRKYPLNGDTAGVSADPVFVMYSRLFRRTVESNGLKTPVYTLTYDSLTDRFVAGIASNGRSTYGWHYESPPAQLKELYRKGGTIPRFEDDHGSWLTAVYPLVNSQGEVFAVLEADYPFDSFLEEARTELISTALVSVLVMLLIGASIYPLLNQILSAEERSKLALESANDLIQNKNREIVSSLEYARTIQETMLPSTEAVQRFFSNCLVFNRPRDIVSGDFYWFYQVDHHRAFVAVADCTGHGVPGALMSIMGHSYLNEVVAEKPTSSPADILEALDLKIEFTFAHNPTEHVDGTDGMDIALCFIDKLSKKITFAGARRPLTVIDHGNSEQIPGTKRGIGEHFLSSDVPFRNTAIDLNPEATYYLFTDGLQDQFGGPNTKKLMRKQVVNWLQEMCTVAPSLQEEWLETRFLEWRGENPQIDDICLLGLRI